MFMIAMAVLCAGCTSAGQPDAGTASPGIANTSAAASAPEDLYSNELASGYGHHTNASALFGNATALWDQGNYAAASRMLQDAQDEYVQAECNYNNMGAYARNDSERAFAAALEESAIDMDEATSRYIMSLDATMAGNDTSSLEYFREGQELVNGSQVALNQSLSLMPPYITLP